MNDLISREDAVKSMTNAIWHYPNEMYAQLNSYEMAEALAKDGLMFIPSAQQWIPCSERLPEKSGKYLVSCKANAYSNITTTAQWQNRYKYWYMTGARSHWRVDAWIPLPDCYQGDENNEM